MKLIKTLTLSLATVALAGLTVNVLAEGSNTAHHAHGAPADHLLPPPLIDRLKLTADQKNAYDTLETSFAKDAAKWHEENKIDPEAVKKAKDTGDKEALKAFSEKRKGLMDMKKNYIDKFSASLTPDQKSELETSLNQHGHRPANKPAPAPAPAQ